MAIQDQNRSRKVYSFYRARPVYLPAGDIDLLFFENVTEMFNYDAFNTRTGTMAFVKTLRDYFFIERDNNPGSTDSIEHVVANSSQGAVGVWHRLCIGGNYWKTQTAWYVNPDTGHDENLGNGSGVPLKTLDELVRRFVGSEKIRDDYTIAVSSAGTTIQNNYGLNVDLDGGTITLTGTPVFGASIGASSNIVASTNYGSVAIPYVDTLSEPLNTGFLYIDDSGYVPIGWIIGNNTAVTYTTLSPQNYGPSTYNVYAPAIPLIALPSISARGLGSIVFNTLQLGGSTMPTVYVGGDEMSTISLVNSDLISDDIEIESSRLILTRSRIRSTSSDINIFNNTCLYATGSGFTALQQNINIKDSHVELVASVLWDANFVVKSSQLIFGDTNSEATALISGSIEINSKSVVDARNFIAIACPANVVETTGQSVKVFYNDSQLPKADSVLIDNGVAQTQQLDWSELPYQDTMRDTLITVGTLQSIL